MEKPFERRKVMKRFFVVLTTVFAAMFLLSSTLATAATVLTFEGLQNQEQILDFYNGGLGGNGSGPGPSFGIVFGPDALALIDADAGGSGNFANEPSPDTIAFFLSGPGAVMNVAAGFTTGFSFYYTSIGFNGSVTVYDALNGAGNILAQVDLVALGSAGAGDPNGSFDTWAAIGVLFGGTAYSVNFSGVANQIGFDEITLGSNVPGQVPEPSTLLLLGSGLVGLVGFGRKKIRK